VFFCPVPDQVAVVAEARHREVVEIIIMVGVDIIAAVIGARLRHQIADNAVIPRLHPA
jgi:hypothetical protein